MVVRPVSGKNLNVPAGNVGSVQRNVINMTIMAHPWGKQWEEQLFDSVGKMGFSIIASNETIQNLDDFEPFLRQANESGARFIVIAQADMEKDTIDYDHASNIGKKLIPLFGKFMDNTATIEVKVFNKFIVYDTAAKAVTYNKTFKLGVVKELSMPPGIMSETYLKQRISSFREIENSLLEMFWKDFQKSVIQGEHLVREQPVSLLKIKRGHKDSSSNE